MTGVDASEEMLAVARQRAADAGRRACTFVSGRCARARVPGSQLRRGRQLARADAHAGLAPLRRRALPRGRAGGRGRLSVGASAAAVESSARRVHSRARRADRTVSRVHGREQSHASSCRTASPSARCIGSSCCRSRCTRRSGRARFTRSIEAVLERARPAAAPRFAGHDRRRAVRVLVTGATGFTGGHLARALAAQRNAGSRAGARPRTGAATWSRPASSSSSAICAIASRDRRRRCRRRRRLPHRRDLSCGRLPTDTYRAINATAVRQLVEAVGRGRRRDASCTAAPSACTATSSIRRPTKTRRSRPATSTRRRSSKASGSRARPAERLGIEVTIARPTASTGPGDRRLLKLFRGVARRRLIMLGSGEIYYHLTYIDDLVEGFRLCGEHPAAANRTYILAGAEVTTLNELVRSVAEVARRAAADAASAGVAVLDRRRGVRGDLRAARHRTAALSAGASTSSRRAARSTSRARAQEIGYAPAVGLRDGIARTLALVPGSMAGSKAQDQLFAPGKSRAREVRASLIVGRPGLAALLKYELDRVDRAGARRRARAGAAQVALSGAPRRLRPQRRLRPERRAAPSAQDSHRQQRRRSTTTACSTRRARRNRGITIGDGVFIGRNTILSCKNGDIEIARRREHRLQLRDVLGEPRRRSANGVLMAAYAYIVGGDHDFSDPTKSVLEQTRTSAGVSIGAGAWIGAGAKLLDGVVVGERAIIGAGAVVRENVPALRGRRRGACADRPDDARRVTDGGARDRHVQSAGCRRRPPRHRARAGAGRARSRPRRATSIVTPDYGFGQQTRSYLANYRTDVRGFDQVISLRYPSYAVRHRRHVCWLKHTMREYYDQWPQFVRSISPANQLKERVRRSLTHIVDRHVLKQHVTKLCALSQTVRDRAAHDFGIDAEVVYPPPPQRPYRLRAIRRFHLRHFPADAA